MDRECRSKTNPSAVFIYYAHTMGLAAEAPPRRLQHTHICLHEPTYTQSFAEPDPPSSQWTLATEPLSQDRLDQRRPVVVIHAKPLEKATSGGQRAEASWQQEVGALRLAKLAVTVKVKKVRILSETCGETASSARATQARASTQKTLRASMRKRCASGLSAPRTFEKALSATSRFLLGGVTVPWCYYLAKVFHELNASSVDLLQSVFVFSLRPFCAVSICAPLRHTGGTRERRARQCAESQSPRGHSAGVMA